jgi:hypothetical protein
LRKSLIAAGAAVLAISGAGVAYAQNAAPSIVVNTSVSPSKAGTKKKPKAEKFTITVTNNVSESKATASTIKITFPSTLRLSTKGLPQCTKSDDALINGGPNICKKSIAGSGFSDAVVGPATGNPANIKFTVIPIVGKNQMLYYLPATAATTPNVLHGKIRGSSQTISIPAALQQPAPGLFSAIQDLHTVISLKKGKHSLVTSTGCSGGHKVTVTETFVNNPGPPAAPSATQTGIARCKK